MGRTSRAPGAHGTKQARRWCRYLCRQGRCWPSRTVRAVRQVTRPVSQTRHTAGLRGNPNLVTGRVSFSWVLDLFCDVLGLNKKSNITCILLGELPRTHTV